jgi:CIC family chloride channel protein
LKDAAQKLIRLYGYFPVIEACVIGIAAGASALLLGAGINWLGSLRLFFCQNYPAMVVLPLFGLVGGVISGCMLLISPDTSGSGIPQVRAVLNRMNLPLDLRVAIAKLIGGTVALGSGLFMGREGPTVQVGAAIAGQLARWVPTTVESRRYLISAGAGAGLAAAFSAPIAGVVFVIEELLKEFKPAAVALCIVSCFSACLIEQHFGTPHKIVFHKASDQVILFAPDLLFLVILGISCGFLGSLFNRAILLLLRFFKYFQVPKPIKVGLAGLITGVIVAFLPDSLHDYAGARAMINSGTLSGDLVPVVFASFSSLTFIAYGSGAPGGLFAPSLSIGSSLGYMHGVAEQYWMGSGSTHMFAIVGMGAFFAAVSRAPLTAIVIVFEMASDFTLVPPLMIACVIASFVGDCCYKGGLYDLLMVWNGLHVRNPGEPSEAAGLFARDVMKTNFEKLESGTTQKDALEKIERLKVLSLSVVKKGKLIGVFIAAERPAGTDLESVTVDSAMATPPLAVAPHDSAEDMLFLFSRYKFPWLPVTDDSNNLIGVVWQKDLITATFPPVSAATDSSNNVDTGSNNVDAGSTDVDAGSTNVANADKNAEANKDPKIDS